MVQESTMFRKFSLCQPQTGKKTHHFVATFPANSAARALFSGRTVLQVDIEKG